MDAFNGLLLILLGVGGLALLWVAEHRPTWVPQRVLRLWPKPSFALSSPIDDERAALISMDEVVHLLMPRIGYEGLTGPAFRAFLREGQIVAYGKPVIRRWDTSSGHELGPEIKIPSTYWDPAEPQWTSHNKTSITKPKEEGELKYGEVRFVRNDVIRCYFGDEKQAKSTAEILERQ